MRLIPSAAMQSAFPSHPLITQESRINPFCPHLRDGCMMVNEQARGRTFSFLPALEQCPVAVARRSRPRMLKLRQMDVSKPPPGQVTTPVPTKTHATTSEVLPTMAIRGSHVTAFSWQAPCDAVDSQCAAAGPVRSPPRLPTPTIRSVFTFFTFLSLVSRVGTFVPRGSLKFAGS